MKIVKISGGVGNQLFQIAFGKYLSNVHGLQVYYDINTEQNISYFTNRKPLILDLIPSLRILNFNQNRSLFFYRFKRFVIKNYLPKLTNLCVENGNNQLMFNDDLIAKKKYFDGYWQSLIYIKPIEKLIRNEINFSNEVKNKCLKQLKTIRGSVSCSIHIRRGDYLNKKNSELFYLCDLNYYYKCIGIIQNIESTVIFYVFSDDIEWAKQNLVAENLVFFSNENNNALIDLYLMSNCNFNIISNSTFSWWGAWLNLNLNKKVICPSRWYKDNLLNANAINNLIPEDWLLVE